MVEQKHISMAFGDPGKRRTDRRFVSWGEHEIICVMNQLAKEFPAQDHHELRIAVFDCRQTIQLAQGRDRLKACARGKLR